MSGRSERRAAGHPLGLRYPGWAFAVAVVAVLVATSQLGAVDYGEGETAAMVIAIVVTWAIWYGVVLLVGWVVRQVRRGGAS